MKITLSELFEHSIIIYCYDEQLRYCLNHFQKVFGKKLADKILYIRGFQYYNSQCLNAFADKARNCTVSHAMAIKIAKQLNWPFACIFEEDAWFNDQMYSLQQFEDALSNIPDNTNLAILGLLPNCNGAKTTYNKINDFYSQIHCSYRICADYYGSHAYLVIGKKGFEHRYKLLQQTGIADNMSFSSEENGCYSTTMFFEQNNSDKNLPNTIHKSSMAKANEVILNQFENHNLQYHHEAERHDI